MPTDAYEVMRVGAHGSSSIAFGGGLLEKAMREDGGEEVRFRVVIAK